jgi:gluconate kinase
MNNRSDLYMKSKMFRGQFDVLEEPTYGLVVEAALPVAVILGRILEFAMLK